MPDSDSSQPFRHPVHTTNPISIISYLSVNYGIWIQKLFGFFSVPDKVYEIFRPEGKNGDNFFAAAINIGPGEWN
jgi:hypothetical protein